MPDTIQSHLKNLHEIFRDTDLDDTKTMRNYIWTVAKQLNNHVREVDSLTCRQLLADCIKLPIERPSSLYSALLSTAVKVAATHHEFRFSAFVRMWGIENLRSDDNERQQSNDGKTFPSLAERTAKALGVSLLTHPEPDGACDGLTSDFEQFLSRHGYTFHHMLVTRVKEALGRDGRKYRFVTLTSPDGLETEGISNKFHPNPLRPLPAGKRHFANVGQLYCCLLRQKPTSVPEPTASSFTLTDAYLSDQNSTEVFSTEIGYIETIDSNSGLMHVYDSCSRHFVAHVLRFSREKVGDFVRFIPVVPKTSKFKTAIIIATVPSNSPEVQATFREIRITTINKEKGYAAWELIDKTRPITELLSPLQLSQGETSPSFTSGYLNLTEELSSSLSSSSYKSFIYLKRGKDRQKRPHIARLFS